MNEHMDRWFRFDERLGIKLPHIDVEWVTLSAQERSDILLNWEQIRGKIPFLISKLETAIIEKQQQLDREDNFPQSCSLNSEIAQLASRINDLHIWFRIHQDIDMKSHLE